MHLIHKIKNELLKNKVLTIGLIIYNLLLILLAFLPKFAVSIALIIGLSCFVFPITTLFIIFAKIVDHRFSKIAILLSYFIQSDIGSAYLKMQKDSNTFITKNINFQI